MPRLAALMIFLALSLPAVSEPQIALVVGNSRKSRKPNAILPEFFRQVRVGVAQETNNKQVPWVSVMADNTKRRSLMKLPKLWFLVLMLCMMSILYVFTQEVFAELSSLDSNLCIKLSEQKKLALVIGNADYKIKPLKNPVNDADDISSALERLGFDVTLEKNINRKQFLSAVWQFEDKIKPGDLAIFYFSGHGNQNQGKYYLLPIVDEIKNEIELKIEGIYLNDVLSAMERTESSNIFILDTSRENLFGQMNRSYDRIRIGANTSTNSIIIYATSSGAPAFDGVGGSRNSVFTSSLLQTLDENPFLEIHELFIEVRKKVVLLAAEEQMPEMSSTLSEPVYLAQPCSPSPKEAPVSIIAPRHALLIANAAYTVGRLTNPIADAEKLKAALEANQFQVILKTDLTNKTAMKQALLDYQKTVPADAVSLLYYAGHGVQYENRSYLVPVNADIHNELDIEEEAIAADYMLAQIGYNRQGINIMILDACRDTPYRSLRGNTRGLARIEGTTGSFIVYATAPGDVATDDGIFATHLAAVMEEQPHLDIGAFFREVRVRVMRDTNNKQVPWVSESLTERFCFGECRN